jgi:dephospho-CoA kinase
VTGNISSGKSTVAKALEQHGAVVVDADQLARDVVEAGTKTLERLVGAFGEEILQSDGSLNRERLGQMVFADTKVRATLNQIVHPEIARKSIEVLQRLRERDDIPLVVYEAPLLFEVGAETRVDKVLVVKIDSKEQLKRLMSRDHLGEVEAKQRIAAQMSQDKKLARADYVIDNSGTISDVLLQVEKLWPKLVGKNGV